MKVGKVYFLVATRLRSEFLKERDIDIMTYFLDIVIW
jgi:hypothetical protein